jgi:acyl carrier protein
MPAPPEGETPMGRDEIRKTLVDLLEDNTAQKFDRLNDDDDLRESLGLDSVDLVTLIVHARSRLDIDIRTEELGNVTSVGHLLDLFQAKLAAAARPAA